MRRAVLLFLLMMPPVLLGDARGSGEDGTLTDESILRAAGLTPDGLSVLHFLRERTQPTARPDHVQALIRQWKSGTAAERDNATAQLIYIGIPAVPLLRMAAQDRDDPESYQRAQHCLDAIENPSLPLAAVRLVAQRRPEGAAEGLLAYLPCADDDNVSDEVRSALRAFAWHNGKPRRALLNALEDPLPSRCAAAAVAMCAGGKTAGVPFVHPLLKDPKPAVRLQVALALAELYDPDALPVLIALLEELATERAQLVENFLQRLAEEQAPAITLRKDRHNGRECRAAWAAWWTATDGAKMLDVLRARTLTDADRASIETLIRQLGDESFQVRQNASQRLVSLGSRAIFLLQQAVRSADEETRGRAEDCLRRLQKEQCEVAPRAAARIVAFRRPPGAAQALLDFLPFAEDCETAQSVREAVRAVATDRKVEPLLVEALAEASPLKRAAAAEALCYLGPEQRRQAGKLLQDPEPSVRLRVALAFAACGDPAAVPVLIELLAELSISQGWQAKAVLEQLAGSQAPKEELGFDKVSQNKCRDAWAQWWSGHAATTDFDRLRGPPPLYGDTLLLQVDASTGVGRVSELNSAGKPRWQFTDLRSPTDAQLLSGHRILLAELQGMQVTERDLKGRVLWRMPVVNGLGCQRLLNGNTFCVARDQLLELDRKGKESFTYRRPAFDIVAARKLASGEIICVLASGTCLRLDATGKELSSFGVGIIGLGSAEVLSSGRVLIAQTAQNRVAEFDRDGKLIWEASCPAPFSATRAANGHTLVTSQNYQRVSELDPSGKIVWDYRSAGRPIKAWRY